MVENWQEAVKAASDATQLVKRVLETILSICDTQDLATPSQEPASASAMVLNVNPAFRFRDLPAELRLEVYRRLLLSSCEIDPVYGRDFTSIYPAILRVSKRIHEEAEPVLYTENIFAAWVPSSESSQATKLWHRGESVDTLLPLSSSRKISRIHLYIYISAYRTHGLFDSSIIVNANSIAKKLALNTLKLLKLTIRRTTQADYEEWLLSTDGDRKTDELLEIGLNPLKTLRAMELIIDGPCSPDNWNPDQFSDLENDEEGDEDADLGDLYVED